MNPYAWKVEDGEPARNPFNMQMYQQQMNEYLMNQQQQPQQQQQTPVDRMTSSFWNAAAAGNPSGNYNAQGPVNQNQNYTDTNLQNNSMQALFNNQLNGFGGWGN